MQFKKGEEILFLSDYDDQELSRGWIHSKVKDDKTEEDIYHIVFNKDDLDIQTIDKNKMTPRRVSFIKKNDKKTMVKYKKINNFLNKNFVKKRIMINSEKVIFLNKNNSVFRIIWILIYSIIKRILRFIWFIIIVGLFRLIFGDLIDYFPNRIRIYKLRLKINEEENDLKMTLNMFLGAGIDSTYIKQKKINKIKDLKNDLEETIGQNENISRSLIAMIIAIVSMFIAIKSLNA
jgi:hypothetical protein